MFVSKCIVHYDYRPKRAKPRRKKVELKCGVIVDIPPTKKRRYGAQADDAPSDPVMSARLLEMMRGTPRQGD